MDDFYSTSLFNNMVKSLINKKNIFGLTKKLFPIIKCFRSRYFKTTTFVVLLHHLNIFLVKRPYLVLLFSMIIIIIFNTSVAYCSVYGDSLVEKIILKQPNHFPPTIGLLEAAKANRSQCFPNLYGPQPQPFKDVSHLYPDYKNMSSIPTIMTPGNYKLPFAHSISKQYYGLLDAAYHNRSQCHPNLNLLDAIYNHRGQGQSNLNHLVNENNNSANPSPSNEVPLTKTEKYNLMANGMQSDIFKNILNAQERNPAEELKSLVHNCINKHPTKTAWTPNGSGINLVKLIMQKNTSVIHSVNDVNEKIIRAHINVQLYLENLALTKGQNIQDLLKDESSYDSLLKQQFMKK